MKRSVVFFLVALPLFLGAQDLSFGRKMVNTLTSPYFWGRGYTNNGMQKAADFLAKQFESYGLKPMDGKKFLQPFSFSANGNSEAS